MSPSSTSPISISSLMNPLPPPTPISPDISLITTSLHLTMLSSSSSSGTPGPEIPFRSPLSISSLLTPNDDPPTPSCQMLDLVHAVQTHFPSIISSGNLPTPAPSPSPSPSPAQDEATVTVTVTTDKQRAVRVQKKKGRKAAAKKTITPKKGPLNCLQCDRKNFSSTSALKLCSKHAKSHNRPYACHGCDLTFATARDMHRHTRRHESRIEVWECSCGVTFTRDYNMRRHQRQVQNRGCEMKGKFFTANHGGRRAPITKGLGAAGLERNNNSQRGGGPMDIRGLCDAE